MVVIMVIYGWYSDEKYYETIENGLKSSHKILQRNCRDSYKSSSNVKINVEGKDYFIKLSSELCSQFVEQRKINVYYLEKYDEYIFRFEKYNEKLPMIIVFFVISLLPWTYLSSKQISKKKIL